MSKVLLVGNYCHDTLIHPHGTFEVLGGSSSYISAAFSGLGLDFDVIAKVGLDFKYEAQLAKAPIYEPHAKTTHFIDDYTSGGARTARVGALCDPIFARDLPRQPIQIGIACGVATEILPETLLFLRTISETLICDIQGLIRAFDRDGNVSHRPLSETRFAELLDVIDILKISEDESKFVDLGALTQKIKVVITQEKDGCTVLDGDHSARVPAYPAEAVDSTGAGDSFIAGLTDGLLQGMSLEQAARRGNYFGSLAVRTVGVPNFSSIRSERAPD